MTSRTHSLGLADSFPSRLFLALSLIVALGPCTVDLYVAAFPTVRADFAVSASTVQLTLTATTLGIALGQLVTGPWSDMIGRRIPVVVASATHIVGSLGVAMAPGIEIMLGSRFLQGVGAAGGGVVATAIVRDLFEGSSFVKASARLAIVGGLAPVVAPFLGGLLLEVMTWRELFFLMAAYGAIVLIASVTILGESGTVQSSVSDRSVRQRDRYKALLADRRFMAVSVISGMIVSAVFAYMTVSSFLFQTVYGLDSKAYGLVFAINAVAFVLGAQTCSRLIDRFSPTRILSVTLPSLVVVSAGIAMAGLLPSGLVPVVGFTAVFFALAGASGPCNGVIAMSPHKARAGSAAAVMGAVSFGLAGIASPLAGLLGVMSATPIGIVMGAAALVAVVVFILFVRTTGTNEPRSFPAGN